MLYLTVFNPGHIHPLSLYLMNPRTIYLKLIDTVNFPEPERKGYKTWENVVGVRHNISCYC